MAAKGIYLERRLIESEAWLSLTGTAISVFLIFRLRCRLSKQGRKGKESWSIDNNGEIIFTYEEAKKKYGISPSSFRRAIDELIAKGFIDIAGTGMGVHKVATYYAISERWRLYGQPHFITKKRPKRPKGWPGYKLGNKLWRKGQKKMSTVINEHGTTVVYEHGEINTTFINEHGQKVEQKYKWIDDRWLRTKIA